MRCAAVSATSSASTPLMLEEDLGGRAPLEEAGPPSKPPTPGTFPGCRPPVERIAKKSAPPAGGSWGSPFSGGDMRKQEHIAIQCDLPCIPKYRTAVMGCPVFDDIGVFLCNIPTVALAFDCPLFTVHCSLLIAHCHHPPQKKFPGAGPRAYRICNTECISGGLAPGKSGRGRLGGVCLSGGGQSLQGLLLWRSSSQSVTNGRSAMLRARLMATLSSR